MAGLYCRGAALATVCSTQAANFLGASNKLVLGAVFPVGNCHCPDRMELFTGDAMLVP